MIQLPISISDFSISIKAKLIMICLIGLGLALGLLGYLHSPVAQQQPSFTLTQTLSAAMAAAIPG